MSAIAAAQRTLTDLPEEKVLNILASMENNLLAGAPDQQSDVETLLENLESDRVGLVERLRQPTWLDPSLGALAAIYIATPALPKTFDHGFVVTTLIIVSILLVLGYERVTGVKLLRFHAFEGGVFAAAIIATLVFFSVSLGLEASGLPWWIIASTVVGFVVVTLLARLAASSMRERVLDVG
jgi:hypothetical protein